MSKAVAAIPKVAKAVGKGIQKGVQDTGKTVSKTIDKGKEKIKENFTKETAEEDLNGLKEDLKKLYEGYELPIRGITRTGASGGERLRSLWKLTTPFDEFELGFGMIEACKNNTPVADIKESLLKKGGEIYDSAKDKSKELGKWIYEQNIPLISDYYGALLDGREEEAEINAFSTAGKFARGFDKGAILTVEGIGNIIINPIETVHGLSTALSNIDETVVSICKEVKDVWNETVINGNAEDRAELLGQVAFEIVSYFIGAGEAKAAVKATTFADDAAEIIIKTTAKEVGEKATKEVLEKSTKKIIEEVTSKGTLKKVGEEVVKEVGEKVINDKNTQVDISEILEPQGDGFNIEGAQPEVEIPEINNSSEELNIKDSRKIYDFKAPGKRHYYNRISKNSKVIDKNTIIEPYVDVQLDVELINSGKAARAGNDFYINDRIYGITSNGELYPKTGNGFHQLDRGGYKALILLRQHGLTPKGLELLKLNKLNEQSIKEAIKIYKIMTGE